MSILVNKETRVLIQGGAVGVNAARRMAEFCHLNRLPLNVRAFVYPPDVGKTADVPFGSEIVTLPIFKTVKEATTSFLDINTSLVYIGAERAYGTALEALQDEHIKLVSMITEGVPEKDAKRLTKEARCLGKIFNGPSSIGIISAGECRLGVVGGAYENLILSKLYRQGSFGVLSKSGGLLNEIIWMVSQFGDGITTAIGIGGDAYPGSDYVTYLEMFENDPRTKAVVIIGEVGGDLEERAAEWYAEKRRRIKLIATIAGTCQENLPKGMKFGHAGAKEGEGGRGSAKGKMEALRKAGAEVAPTFGDLSGCIQKVYGGLSKAGVIRPIEEIDPATLPQLPTPIEKAIKDGGVLVEPIIKSTICDDRGDEPCYAGYAASELINKGYDIPHVIGLLWLKRLPKPHEAELIKRIIILSADHGPCVSGAMATIIAACADIPLSQAVSAGLTMIGPRFGGAVTDAGRYWKYAVDNRMTPEDFLAYMKKNVGPVPGIGHRVKSVRNPDKRVKELVGFVKGLDIPTPHLDFALKVEAITTTKKDTLILNVDGAIGAILMDLGFPIETLNGFFILARTIGFIGHWIDQKRMDSRMMRMPTYLVNYATPPKQEVPPLEEAKKERKKEMKRVVS